MRAVSLIDTHQELTSRSVGQHMPCCGTTFCDVCVCSVVAYLDVMFHSNLYTFTTEFTESFCCDCFTKIGTKQGFSQLAQNGSAPAIIYLCTSL